MIFGAAAARASLIELVCPECGERQVRARGPAWSSYECRKCHRRFSRADGEAIVKYGKRPPRSPAR